MTAIVGFANKGRVWIGGDSAGTAYDGFQVLYADPKVFRVGPLLVGFTYSFRMGQLLRYKLKVPDHDPRVAAHEWLCVSVMDAVRELFRANAFTWIENGRELAGPFLIGYAGKLYEVDSQYSVGHAINGMAAVGCGRDLALGALHASRGKPATRIRNALSTAAVFNSAVRGPFVVESV